MSTSFFLHVDLDAFFASVEQLDFPQFRGKPVIVGGLPTDRRSVVSTCSYEARKFGVHSAMPTAKAFKLCPQGIYLRGRMDRYHEKSVEVMNILKNYSPDVQQMSVDEAFLDLTGTERLFGPPDETASKLKKEVMEKTGLTISVGMATNKYLAKIASGLSKPDGFFVIRDGEEEKFMLTLPLKKVWGVGTKTLEKINNAGFRTTEDIHKASLPLLTSIFGDCTADFLYNAVRGHAVKNFDEPVKNRSISTETTFCFDLTDSFTIETALLNLSSDVFFRLLQDNLSSKTVSIKIRYEDFTTVSIQDTSSNAISSSDELYERSLKLFRKKYQQGRGIRLLGIAVQNIENGLGCEQKELFDFGNQKKQAVEKAILSLQKKNPSSTVRKARLFIKQIIFSLFLIINYPLIFSQTDTKTEPTATAITAEKPIVFNLPLLPSLLPEAPKSLYSYGKNNKNIEFIAEGYWESKISSGFNLSIEDSVPKFDTQTFVFQQKVDLSMWFLLNKKWYFEAIFTDGFDKNTIAAGYYSNGILKHARIGNNGIVFPDAYSVSKIGGENSQSPGLMAHFAGSKWQADAVIRYDNLEAHEKSFTGANEITESEILATFWEQGRRFVLPSIESAAAITGVYVQNDEGEFTDAESRTYKKLSESQYLVKPAQSLLLLAKAVTGTVIVSFSNISITEGSLGNFQNESTFLGAVAKIFSDAKKPITNISTWSYGKSDNSGFFTSLKTTNEKVLILQNPTYFSPFAISDYYNIGNSKYEDATLISNSTKQSLQHYRVIITKDDASFIDTDYVKASNTYARLLNESTVTTSFSFPESAPYLNPKNRYPLVLTQPEIYLNSNAKTDISLGLKSYSEVSTYDIGTDAVPGSVRVYKNGILDGTASYNSKTGNIEFPTQPTSMDRIRVTWQQHNSTSTAGAITAATGLKINLSNFSTFDAALLTSWSYSPDKKFSEPEATSPGTLEFASGYSYKKNNLNFSNKIQSVFSVDDVTGIQRILSMDENIARTIYFGTDCIVSIPESIIPVLNSRSLSGTQTAIVFPELKKNMHTDFSTVGTFRDSGISGYAIELNWDFVPDGSTEYPMWAATSIDLSSASTELASSNSFSIALRNLTDISTITNEYEIYLQLGVDADEDISWENSNSIPTWKISKKSSVEINPDDVKKAFIIESSDEWQEVSVALTDIDRSRLINYSDARIIIVSTTQNTGGIRVGPFETSATDFSISKDKEIDVTLFQKYETPDTTNLADYITTFNTDELNSVQEINWQKKSSASFTDTITVDRYIPEISLSSYSTLNLMLYIDNEYTSYKITFNRPTSVAETFETAACFTIPIDTVKTLNNSTVKWHLVTLDLENEELLIDNKIVNNAEIEINKSISPTHFIFEIVPDSFSADLIGTDEISGTVKIDELFLEGVSPQFLVKDEANFSWKKTGDILKIKSFSLLSDIEVNSKFSGSYIFTDDSFAVGGTASASAKIAGISISGKVSRTTDSDTIYSDSTNSTFISAASHSIKTTNANPLFKHISISEQYNLNRNESFADKTDTVLLTSPFKNLPTTLKFSTQGTASTERIEQKLLSDFSFSIPGKKFSWQLKAKVDAQQIQKDSNLFDADSQNYVEAWQTISELQFSNGNEDAVTRIESMNISQTLTLPWLQCKPVLAFEGKQMYLSGTQLENTGTTAITLTIPFTIAKNQFSVAWKKQSKEIITGTNFGTYTEDATSYFNSLERQTWLFKTIPFADLFSADLPNTISTSNETNDSLVYTSTYTLSWKRPLSLNARINLLLPNSFSLITARDILNTTGGNTTDTIQYKALIGYSALNCFGRFSLKPIFKWYEQDEFSQSYSVSLKFLDNSAVFDSYIISGYNSFILFLPKKEKLQNVLNFQLNGSDAWNIKNALTWTHTAKSSPVAKIIFWILPKLKKETLVLNRKNIFSYQITDTGDMSQTAGITHQLESKIGKYVTITSDLGFATTIYENLNLLFQVTAALTGKVLF